MRQPRSDEAIRLGPQGQRGPEKRGVDWRLVRAVFMRILGLAWLAKGLYGGAMIIGVMGGAFEALPSTDQASLAFSTIGDCVAGVGLWLTVDWGAVTWIAVVIVEVAFAFGSGAAIGMPLAMLMPVLVYLGLAILGARQVDERS
jgi:hypothetical protein